MNDEYEYRTPIDKRKRRSLTTICVQIKPSHPQEEPYVMCEGGKFPRFVQQIPYTKNNIFLSNDRNITSTLEYGQDKSNYVAGQHLPHFKNLKYNIRKENSWSGEEDNYQNKILFNQYPSQQSTFYASKFFRTPPTRFNSETTTATLNSNRFDQRFSTSMPSILSRVEYLKMKRLNDEAKELPLVNDAIHSAVRLRDIERKRKNIDENRLELDWTGIQLKSEAGILPRSLSESNREKQIFKNFDTLPFCDDPVMQQFYNSIYDTPVPTISHSDTTESIASKPPSNELSKSNQQHSAQSLQNKLPHTTIRSQSIQDGQSDDFQKEAISISEAPSNQYCNACPLGTRYTLPPMIINLPCYNPSLVPILPDSWPCYRPMPSTCNNLPYQNFVCENQHLKGPEARELVGSSYNPLVNIFQPNLFPHFSMIPRLGGLLGSTRALFPMLHVAHGIFRSTTPIPRISQSNTLTYTSQPASMESPLSVFSNDLRAHIEDVTVTVQLDNIQTTTLPIPTTLTGPSGVISSISIKSIEDLQNSTEDSSILQSQSQIRKFITAKPTAITQASITEDGNQTGEKPTKKIFTIIEKARRLQMRHRINSN